MTKISLVLLAMCVFGAHLSYAVLNNTVNAFTTSVDTVSTTSLTSGLSDALDSLLLPTTQAEREKITILLLYGELTTTLRGWMRDGKLPADKASLVNAEWDRFMANAFPIISQYFVDDPNTTQSGASQSLNILQPLTSAADETVHTVVSAVETAVEVTQTAVDSSVVGAQTNTTVDAIMSSPVGTVGNTATHTTTSLVTAVTTFLSR